MDASYKEKAEQLATEFAADASTIGELNALLRTMMKRGLETMLDSEMDQLRSGSRSRNPLWSATPTQVPGFDAHLLDHGPRFRANCGEAMRTHL